MTTATTEPAVERGARQPGCLTLDDVLHEDLFRLALVAGDEQGVGRPVLGAHCVEADVAGSGLEQDWIALTTGASLQDDPEAQRRLIAELDLAGAAALGLCLGASCDEVPGALVAEAERCGIPVFSVPRTTPPRELIAFVQRSLVSEEALAFSRMAALQRFLMDALGQQDPKRTLVARLAEFLQAKAGVLEPNGRFSVATAADIPAAGILEALEGRQTLTVPVEIPGFHGHAFALGDPERSGVAWLVVGVSSGRRLHPLTKAAGGATVPLLGAINRLDQAQRLRDGAARQATFDALLEAETVQEARVAAAQLSVWGVEISAGVAAVAFADASGRLAPEALLDAVAAAGICLEQPMLATVCDGHVASLMRAPVTDEILATLRSASGVDLRAGVGRTVTEPRDARRSVSEAVLATRSCPGQGAVGRYDDLDLGTLVLQELQLERLAPKIEAWLLPLRATPRVFETLVAYLKHNLDVGRTAEALHLHPNSVRYRLARAEELIGAPVRSPSTMIALHVAIAASEASEQPRAA
jgi:purine catabolism regulator